MQNQRVLCFLGTNTIGSALSAFADSMMFSARAVSVLASSSFRVLGPALYDADGTSAVID